MGWIIGIVELLLKSNVTTRFVSDNAITSLNCDKFGGICMWTLLLLFTQWRQTPLLGTLLAIPIIRVLGPVVCFLYHTKEWISGSRKTSAMNINSGPILCTITTGKVSYLRFAWYHNTWSEMVGICYSEMSNWCLFSPYKYEKKNDVISFHS